MRSARLTFFLFAALLLAAAVRAQSVHWESAGTAPNTLQLVFDDCAPDGDPQLPNVAGVTFTQLGTSTSTNIVNFNFRSSVIITYLARARQSGPIKLPVFTVETNKGRQRVAAFESGGITSTAPSVASSQFVPERTTVWAGEVFGLTYELTAASRSNPQVSPNFEWNPAPLTIEDWTKPEVTEDTTGGERRVHVIYRTRAVANTPNTVKLEAASHLLNIQTGTVGLGFFTQSRMEPISVTSDQPIIHVRALPAAPAGFSGAIGDFKLTSKVVPEKAAVGEPVTWTLELSGTGNWPDFAGLPPREVSNDFQVVQPKAKRTPAEGKLFDVTLAEDVVLVPIKAGSYTLGPVNVSYFDPKSGSYQTLSVPRTTLTITAPSAPQLFNVGPATAQSTPTDTGQASAGNAAASAPLPPPTVPAAPAGIPSDPLPGAAKAMSPLATDTLVLWLLTPVPCLLLFWSWLALRRARQTDPFRPYREARARLADTLARLRTATEAGRPALLLQWQHDTAALWQIVHAAPPATTLSDPVWAALWAESDCALYGARTELPADWVARAEAALAAKRVPGFQPFRLFLPRNLLPFAALAFGAVFVASTLRAEEPTAAYRRGDFTAAEKAWRTTLAKTPTDWIARHNLSLALAQQDQAGEAAAQAAAAFVQNPADPSVRWHFALATEKAGFAPAPLAPFLQPGPVQSLARLASPACWQMTLIACAALAALALGGLLLNAYSRRSRAVLWSALSVLGLSALVAGSALVSVLAYGEAADRRAVVAARAGTLRSIPTEADTAQKTTPLPAGSVAIADPKTYLGWTRLSFENGQTGWVRKEDIVALWQ